MESALQGYLCCELGASVVVLRGGGGTFKRERVFRKSLDYWGHCQRKRALCSCGPWTLLRASCYTGETNLWITLWLSVLKHDPFHKHSGSYDAICQDDLTRSRTKGATGSWSFSLQSCELSKLLYFIKLTCFKNFLTVTKTKPLQVPNFYYIHYLLH